MAVLTFTQDFSRCNDDRNQNIYETARITISLIVNNDDCSQDVRNCSGAVTARLRYEAVSTTNDPQFGQGGRTFGLVDLIPPAPGALPQAAAYARLQHQPANPPPIRAAMWSARSWAPWNFPFRTLHQRRFCN